MRVYLLYLLDLLMDLQMDIRMAWMAVAAWPVLAMWTSIQTKDSQAGTKPSRPYVWAMAGSMFALALIPYCLGGYQPNRGFFQNARFFSTANAGLALLIAGFVAGGRLRRSTVLRPALFAVLLAFLVSFHARRGLAWKEAARLRNDVVHRLVDLVPDVASGTTLLFLDLPATLGPGIPVFRAADGFRNFIRILYGRDDVNAHFLYPYSEAALKSESRIATKNPSEGVVAVARPEGVVARLGDPLRSAPLDSLLILVRPIPGVGQVGGGFVHPIEPLPDPRSFG